MGQPPGSQRIKDADDSQDQSNQSSIPPSNVRFTTTELTDSLRRSSSQPAPLPVRGNVARRISLAQQASPSQSHARSSARSHKHQSGSKSKAPSTMHSQSQSQSQRQHSPQYETPEHPHPRISQLFSQQSNISEPSYINTSSQATLSQASSSQLSSPASQNGDSTSSQKSGSKKHRHRKKKRPLPVTSPFHGKNASQSTVHVAGASSGPNHIPAPSVPTPAPAPAPAPIPSQESRPRNARKTGGTKVTRPLASSSLPQKWPNGDSDSKLGEKHDDNDNFSLALDYDNSSSNGKQGNARKHAEMRHEPVTAKTVVSTIELVAPVHQKKAGDKAKDRSKRQVLSDVTAAMTQSQRPAYSKQLAPTVESSDPQQSTQSLEITTHSQIEPGQRIPSSYSFDMTTTESQEFRMNFDSDSDEDNQNFQDDFNHQTESPDAVSQERGSSLVPSVEVPLLPKSSVRSGAREILQGIKPVLHEVKEVLDFIEIRNSTPSPKPPSRTLNRSKDRIESSPKARFHKRKAQQEVDDVSDENVDYDSFSSREASPVLMHTRTTRRNARNIFSEEHEEPQVELDSPSPQTRKISKPIETQVAPMDLSFSYSRASSKSVEPHIELLDSPPRRTRASSGLPEDESLLSRRMSGMLTRRVRAPVSYKEAPEWIKDDDFGLEIHNRRTRRTTPTPKSAPKPLTGSNSKQPDLFATDMEYGVDVGLLFGGTGSETTKQKQSVSRTNDIERGVQVVGPKRPRKRIVLESSDFEPSPSASPTSLSTSSLASPLQESSQRSSSPQAPSLERSASPGSRFSLPLSPSNARSLANTSHVNHASHTNDINQNSDVESEDEWEVKRLTQLWKKHNIQWPLRDRTLENKGFREPYSLNFVFGTALPFPRSRR